MGKNQHIVPNPKGGWDIKGEGNSKSTKHTKTKLEAEEIAKNQKSEIIIHNKNGKISDKDSFGNDPCPPKDKKH